MEQMTIHRLPEELLLKILNYIDTTEPSNPYTVASLSQASRRLRRLTLHRVYEKVLIQREPHQGSNRSNPLPGTLISIYNVDAFIEGLQRRPQLTEYIRQLRIDWTPYRPADTLTHSDRKEGRPGILNAKSKTLLHKTPIVHEERGTLKDNATQEYNRIQILLQILKDKPGGIKTHIYLCVNLWRKDKFSEWLSPLLKLSPVHAMELVLPPKPPSHLVFDCFEKEGLEHLLLSSMESLGPLRMPEEANPRANIQALSLRLLAHNDVALRATLFQPRALKSLHIQLQPDFASRFNGSTQDTMPDLYAWHIRHLKDTLEEFFFSIAGQHKGNILLGILDTVQGFPVLKRVGVPSYFLMHFREDVEMEGDIYDATKHAPPLPTTLPKALEELQIEIDPNEQTLEWNEEPDDERSPMSGSAKEFCGWLSGVHKHKTTAFPNLKRVVLWQRDDIYPPFGPPPRFGEVTRFLDACKEERIDFSYHVNQSPPLFGVYD